MTDSMHERWQELSEQLDQAFDLTEAERGPWLEALKAKDPELAGMVLQALKIRGSEGFEDFLQGPSPMAPDALPEPTLVGRQIGPYVIDAEAGRGGMGSVWRAHRADGRYDAEVAIKFVHAMWLGKAGEERFQFEGRVLARLNHPNIARLLDAGVAEVKQPYLVLEFVEGEPIDQYCEHHGLDAPARIRLFIHVLHAVAHAHTNLIVHRDIKPSNVYVKPDGTVKLLDFGIAKLIDSEGGEPAPLTHASAVALTPQYASPEQLLGQPISTVTDVYALGLLLYVLLTGEHPVPQGTRSSAALMQAVLTDEPARASAVGKVGVIPSRTLEGDLDNILNKAIKKNPAERYASVDAFADDLQRYLADEPVHARPDTAFYRMSKFIKRHRVGTALAALAVISLTASLVLATVQAHRAERSAELALAEKARADKEAAEATQQRDAALDHATQLQDVSQLAQFLIVDALPMDKPDFTRKILLKAASQVRNATDKSKIERALMLNWLSDQFEVRRDFESALPLYSEAADLALSSDIKDPETIAASLCRIGFIYSFTNRIPEGIAEIDKALQGIPDKPKYARSRIECYLAKAQALGNSGASSLPVIEAAMKVLPEVQPPDPVGAQNILSHLTAGYAQSMRVPEAKDAYAREEALVLTPGYENPTSTTMHFHNQGVFMWRIGRPLDARRDADKRLSIEHAAGSDTNSAPPSLLLLARIARQLGDLPGAIAKYDECRKAAAQLHDALPGTLATVELLSTLIQAGDYARAAALTPQADKALHASFPPTHWWFGVFKMEQALLADHAGHTAEAQALADEAVTQFHENSPPTYLFPVVLVKHSEFELRHGHADEAKADAEHALAVYDRTFGRSIMSSVVGDALMADGRALAAKGDAAGSRDKFSSAALHYADSLGADHDKTKAAAKLAANQS
jgi:eukaryotic-like serine/threonine-protein kinase